MIDSHVLLLQCVSFSPSSGGNIYLDSLSESLKLSTAVQMTRLLSTGMRFLFIVVVFSFVGCLLMLHPHTKSMQAPNQEYGELEETEELEMPPLAKDLADEFLDENLRVRSLFFPEKENAIDPRKKSQKLEYFPGRIWLDTDGNLIQTHGGGIMFSKISERYFWYGEYKDGRTYKAHGNGTARVDIVGVGCYSSRDLWTWRNEGIVLKSEEIDENHDLHRSNVLERPKVIHNEKTGKYVLWMHIDNANYNKAKVGIAVADSPVGPFKYLHSKSPHGFDSRDMTIFKDEDGTAYLFYSSLHNRELHIGKLSEDYLDVSDVMTRVLVGQHREAPAVFKHNGRYFMITSGCSGWAPNEALAHVAESALGPWETIGNPCVGANQAFRVTTFLGQGTFVLPRSGGPPGSFVFMADRWKPNDLHDLRYIWLPLIVDGPHGRSMRPQVFIFWHGKWKIPYHLGDN